MSGYGHDYWDNAPGGGRVALRDVHQADWLPLSEALTLVMAGVDRRFQGTARSLFLWRLANRAIASKTDEIHLKYSDGTIIYREMPLNTEWLSENWASPLSEVWAYNDLYLAGVGLDGANYFYKGIKVEREGLARLVDHLNAMEAGAASSTGSKRGPKPKYDWLSFLSVAKGKLEHHGGFNAGDWGKADLVSEMIEWCEHEWGEAIPNKTSIYDQIANAEESYKKSINSAN